MDVRNDMVFLLLICSSQVFGFPDQGMWTKSYEKVRSAFFGMHKSLYNGSSIYVSVNCEPYQPTPKSVMIHIGWLLRQTSCFEEYLSFDVMNKDTLRMMYDCPMSTSSIAKVRYKKSPTMNVECSSVIHIEYSSLSFITNKDIANMSPNSLCPPSYSSEDFAIKEPPVSFPTDKKAEINKKSSSNAANSNISGIDSKSVNKRSGAHRRRKRENSVDIVATKQNDVPRDALNADSKNAKHTNNINISQPAVTNALINAVQVPHNLTAVYQDVYSNVKKSGTKIAAVDADGVYLFILKITADEGVFVNLTVDVSIKGEYGYLSAADYPLLLFYGYMCGIYVIYALVWLVVSAFQWRDLLRVQFWIGGVILLGLTEKAIFCAEYQSINYTGKSVLGAVIFAEVLSCMKRTLARMLVIIVSLGFGIVKPRLGPMLHRVVGVGAVYFVLGVAEGCLRVLKPKNDPSNQALMAGVPLAVTDSAICWWIFSSLVQTNRTLRLRRNLVKLSLYRHFTNTLIFAVVASVSYMVWSIHSHKLVTCITDWQKLWFDEAYWHLLFSLILLVIMILWRPTNNNQRYAYTPLLDALDDDNEDDFDQTLGNDAFTGSMKMRAPKNSTSDREREKEVDSKQDDDLKWVEENVPSTFTETAVPTFLDSDEEIMTAKFERNKME